jgi:hypothetical protein
MAPVCRLGGGGLTSIFPFDNGQAGRRPHFLCPFFFFSGPSSFQGWLHRPVRTEPAVIPVLGLPRGLFGCRSQRWSGSQTLSTSDSMRIPQQRVRRGSAGLSVLYVRCGLPLLGWNGPAMGDGGTPFVTNLSMIALPSCFVVFAVFIIIIINILILVRHSSSSRSRFSTINDGDTLVVWSIALVVMHGYKYVYILFG